MQTDVTENNKTAENEKPGDISESKAGAEQKQNADQTAEQTAEQNAEQKPETSPEAKRIEELSEKLSDAETKLYLLLAGIAKEKLPEATRLFRLMSKEGRTPEEAAQLIAESYPYLRSVRHEVPRFSASGSGDGDGFTAIRSIFAKR